MSKLKVKELRAALEARGLDTSGLKSVLAKRLQDAVDRDESAADDAVVQEAHVGDEDHVDQNVSQGPGETAGEAPDKIAVEVPEENMGEASDKNASGAVENEGEEAEREGGVVETGDEPAGKEVESNEKNDEVEAVEKKDEGFVDAADVVSGGSGLSAKAEKAEEKKMSESVGAAKNADTDALEEAKKAALVVLDAGAAGGKGKRAKRGRRRHKRRPRVAEVESRAENGVESGEREPVDDVVIDYVPEKFIVGEDEGMGELAAVLEKFASRGAVEDLQEGDSAIDGSGGERDGEDGEKVATGDEREDSEDGESNADGEGRSKHSGAGVRKDAGELSRRQRKLASRHLISKLKALAEAPQVVEAWDISSSDPLLLVHLKAWPSSVPVPVNWRQKRKYLQNKRGMEKRAFVLPAFIADTGVGEARDAQLEADDKKTLKQKQRDKMRAKSGKGVDVDYDRLHDAFFKFQTKPRLTAHGDVYYELRELEVDRSEFRPDTISDELRAALGIGPDDPPPWLVAFQRYGPPPGYPNLKIQGLNAPIPHGASFGYQPGGWGKPPVDEYGRPIYGDVFGEGRKFGSTDARFDLSEREKSHMWGVHKSSFDFGGDDTAADEDAAASEDEDAGKDKDRVDVDEPKQAEIDAGTESTATLLPGGLDTPRAGIELRKGLAPDALYTVLDERKTSVDEKAMMGSSHVYDMGGAAAMNAGDAAEEEAKSRKEDIVSASEVAKSGQEKKRKAEVVRGADKREAKKQKGFKF